MKKSTKQSKQTGTDEKSFFRSAGETIGTIAHEIVEGKNKLVESATNEFALIKKVIRKKLKKKKAPVPKKKIGTANKKPAKKAAVKSKTTAKKRKPTAKKSEPGKKSKALKPRR
jgi:hypothetical protein